MRRAVLLVLVGCGRVGFTLAGDGDGGAAPPDQMAATDDGGTPIPGCDVTHPDALLCSGFETADLGPWGYTIITNGRAERTTTRSRSGVAALEVETYGPQLFKEARWGVYLLPNVMTGDLYVRAYYWLTSGSTITDQLSLLVIGNGNEPYPATNVRLDPGQVIMVVDDAPVAIAGDLPRDRWVCVQLHINVDAAAGVAEVMFDGAPVLTFNGDTTVAGGYTSIDVGVHYATPDQGPAQLWIDEVIVDTSPIACD